MAIRIYSLAKDLNIDVEELIKICNQIGITEKGSLLASLTDEEVARISAFLRSADSNSRETQLASADVDASVIPSASSALIGDAGGRRPIGLLRSAIRSLWAAVDQRARAESEAASRHTDTFKEADVTFQRALQEAGSLREWEAGQTRVAAYEITSKIEDYLREIEQAIEGLRQFLTWKGLAHLLNDWSRVPAAHLPLGEWGMHQLQMHVAAVLAKSQEVASLEYWKFYHKERKLQDFFWGVFCICFVLLTVLSIAIGNYIYGGWGGLLGGVVSFVLAFAGAIILTFRIKAAASKSVQERLVELFASQGIVKAVAAELKRQAETTYSQGLAACNRKQEEAVTAAQAVFEASIAQARALLETQLNEAALSWQCRLREVQSTLDQVTLQSANLFPAWDGVASRWNPGEDHTAVNTIQFGSFRVDLSLIPNGISRDRRFDRPTTLAPHVPALVPYPNKLSLLITCDEQSKSRALAALQSYMLRLLTVLPPGKVRFTLLDPVGLGQSFAQFMHLADHDEALVTSRIWTEQRHIEEQLARVTEHMEMVIQKYLRGQYRTINEYNELAGEVAEPYRFVVVAGFPARFTQAAADRLLSIASQGRKCGVFVLATLDPRLKLPREFHLKEFEQQFNRLYWEGTAFRWDDDDFGPWPLQLDTPPTGDQFASILDRVGRAAKDGNRVRVPFEFVAPRRGDCWTADSRDGLSVPIGRAGATKRQCLLLGRGTAQHVLIAGRTGSGKSTLLHALIINLALSYGPGEVELYLIDFKKGVEFKPYASHELPHARVVAIESEREFGLSVLQGLDAELTERGERFREFNSQDIGKYRDATGSPLPRILLVIDEFHELFAEDDRIARDSAQLLDRLVRQGRAFGMHVVLGSQTLGGAYTLARSTIDQMAVRIALQCSEADGRLILGDDNPAARLLSRPGEAIYNDANGLVEGNSLFQVAWLPDDERDHHLASLRQLARESGFVPHRPQVIFEGNVPAVLHKNHLLKGTLAGTTPLPPQRVWRAWLGEPVAIKDPTCATFRPQSASNLLIVGQQEETALGIVRAALVGLASQRRSKLGDIRDASFYVFDGTPADSPHTGVLGALESQDQCIVHMVERRRLGSVIFEILAELNQRLQQDQGVGRTVFLVLHGLQNFRDLRRTEESIGRRANESATSNAAKDFLTIVKEGPSVGVHTILWCDTLPNLNRVIDRNALRDFEMRVVLQMGPADSTTLMNSPAAGKLGFYRAYFYQEEKDSAEKFRPYGLPTTI